MIDTSVVNGEFGAVIQLGPRSQNDVPAWSGYKMQKVRAPGNVDAIQTDRMFSKLVIWCPKLQEQFGSESEPVFMKESPFARIHGIRVSHNMQLQKGWGLNEYELYRFYLKNTTGADFNNLFLHSAENESRFVQYNIKMAWLYDSDKMIVTASDCNIVRSGFT